MSRLRTNWYATLTLLERAAGLGKITHREDRVRVYLRQRAHRRPLPPILYSATRYTDDLIGGADEIPQLKGRTP